MKFTIEINMDNAAFEDYPDELSTLLKLVAMYTRHNEIRKGDSESIYDSNGNKVGIWEVTE